MGYSIAKSRLMTLLGALALIAMAVRGVIPSGYMLAPSAAPGQFLNIIVCHGDGSGYAPAVIDLKTGKRVDQDQKSGQSDTGKNTPCSYAATAHFSLPAPAGKLAGPVAPAIAARLSRAFIVPGQGLVAPPPPARGLPLTI